MVSEEEIGVLLPKGVKVDPSAKDTVNPPHSLPSLFYNLYILIASMKINKSQLNSLTYVTV